MDAFEDSVAQGLSSSCNGMAIENAKHAAEPNSNGFNWT